ncbi:MAG: TOBE domain-containing protein [Desulfobacterales bacterium]
MKPRDKVTLCLRPEFIRLKRGDATQAQNVFNGQVRSLVFIGEAYEGEIIINDTRLFIKTEPDSDIKVRDAANFSVDPDQCLLVTR